MKASFSRAAFEKAYSNLILGRSFLEPKEYYFQRKERYWNTLRKLDPFLRVVNSVLDIGGGQFALLTKELYRVAPEVLDLDARNRATVDREGIPFHHLDLVHDELRLPRRFDMVIMGEVIGHVPVPPHLVFEKLSAAMAAGGYLALTTPNLFRLRNLLRMLVAKPLFTPFVLPEKDSPPGHFIEYDQDLLEWQFRKAGFDVEVSEHVQLDLGGSTPTIRIARRLLIPLYAIRPVWRDNLLMVGRLPLTAALTSPGPTAGK